MKLHCSNIRFLSLWKLFIALVLVGHLLRPSESRAAEVASFPAVKDLPVQSAMPDPLAAGDGKPITPAQWPARRAEMKRIIEHYGLGHAPPPPGDVKGKDVETSLLADGKVSYRRVRISFGPEEKLGFDLSIFLPAEATGIKGPFPTIVMPMFSAIDRQDVVAHPNKRANSPESVAGKYAPVLARGYAVATLFYQDCGADNRDYRQSGFFPAYPDHDWADLAAWAWGMSRCVDFLEKQSFADPSKFIAAGHSRLGKATLVAGAFDERFALVAPAGSGCGGTGAYRFNGKGRGGKEGLEDVVKNFPQWVIPRVAEFSGQVEKLPFDQHWLISLVAPRCFIAADGLSDNATSVNALVQSYQAAKPVYDLLGVPDHLGLHFRPGGHQFAPEDWTAILDFADQRLRGMEVKRRFDELPAPEPGN
ncbi:MAG: hypothetical protein V4584_12800 [Verrucomicrobiota bacterium]